MGEEEEKNDKSYQLKVGIRYQIQNFSTFFHFEDGRLTLNVGLKNFGSLYSLYIREAAKKKKFFF